MKQHLLDKITRAIDKITLQFQEDIEIIFRDDMERKELKYSHIKEIKNWEKSRICIYDGCNKPSITRSHTIQKAGSIKAISEQGHTLRPIFNRDKEDLCLELIGDNEASTFPGFCSDHEKLFEGYETSKKLTKPEHFKLQIYRTVCREIVRKEADINGLEKRLKQYAQHREKRLGELIQAELGKDFFKDNSIEFKSSSFEIQDQRKQMLDEAIKDGKETIKEFLIKFKKAIPKKGNSGIYTKVLHLDTLVPVALAGSGNFHINENHKTHNVSVIINILPFDSYTYIIISGLSTDKDYIDGYLSYFSDPLNILNMIEAWMVHGSDHWFIKPSIWVNIKYIYQQKILKDMFDLSRNIGQPYELSIFNDLKRQIIKLLKNNFDKLTPIKREIIKKEEVKISD